MIKLYYHPSPNPAKVALFLEEANLPYEVVPVDTRKGEQHQPTYLAINPNAKTPALTDGEVTIFDSNAILLYLAEKTGKFLPENSPKLRGELLSWLMFIATGIGPYSGQAVHFTHFAPAGSDYGKERYQFEANRHWSIINERLGKQHYLVGNTYTIADMSLWGWTRAVPFIFGPSGFEKFPHLKKWFDEISARPAAAKVEALATKHTYKTDFDADAKRHMFPHTAK
ncbi:MAG TPA: glutathione S-transferase family protein [Kofleriaceae bacterium]|nr:glutathione S-transferase family protein [Kofleriaceae bacterium]